MKKTLALVASVLFLAIGMFAASVPHSAFAAAAGMTNCAFQSQGPYSVQVGQTISENISGPGCGKGIAGEEVVCQLDIPSTPADFSATLVKDTSGPIAGQGVFSVTGIAAGTGTFTINADCSDSVDPDEYPTTTITINVTPGTPPPPVLGTVKVTSENSVVNSVLVPAKWSITDGATSVCNGTNCQGTSQTYSNQPAVGDSVAGAGSIILPLNTVSLLTPQSYVFNSIKLAPSSLKSGGFLATMLSLVRGVVGSTAEAVSLSTATPSSQTLTASGTVSYIILWDPEANIAVNPTSLPLSAAAGSSVTSPVTITNTGAPGSKLTWTATSNSSWLSASPSTNAGGITNGASGNASQSVTITANAAGLAAGTTKTGTIVFTGASSPGTVMPPPTAVLTITFTVTPGSGGSNPVTGVSVGCAPNPINTTQTSNCTATVSGGSGGGVTWTVVSGGGTISSTGVYTPPATVNATTTVTVRGTSKDDPSKSGTGTITVTPTGGSGGGGGGGGSVTGVSVNCAPNPIDTTQTSNCTATITGGSGQGVTWTVVSGGGTISSTGVYTPPPSVAATTTVTIKGTSNQDPSKSNTGMITVVTGGGPGGSVTSVSVNCAPSPINTEETSNCTATIGGGSGQGVTWTVVSGGGTISSTGVYTPPASVAGSITVTVKGTSNQDPSKSGTDTITVTEAPVTGITVSCTPSSTYTNGTSDCNATTTTQNGQPGAPGVTWTVVSGGGTISSTGVYTPPATVNTTTTVTIKVTSTANPSVSQTVTITVLPPPACTPGVNCPVCSPKLTANPSSIVIPESSGLSYSCSNVTACQLTQGSTILSSTSLSSQGTIDTTANPFAVTPTSTTAYTLTCVNSNYGGAGSTVTSNATVTVGGSSLCEQNPNGAGCPGAQ
ncbi:MAG TPA: hypothetical protein VMA75_04535 [Candidatus Paceibacterota bacterium]|nr:hypothetical protein [Candidatus Paceibacterota bacterium]